MDAEKIKQTYGHLGLNDLPDEVRAEVALHPDLEQWFRDMESVQMLGG